MKLSYSFSGFINFLCIYWNCKICKIKYYPNQTCAAFGGERYYLDQAGLRVFTIDSPDKPWEHYLSRFICVIPESNFNKSEQTTGERTIKFNMSFSDLAGQIHEENLKTYLQSYTKSFVEELQKNCATIKYPLFKSQVLNNDTIDTRFVKIREIEHKENNYNYEAEFSFECRQLKS